MFVYSLVNIYSYRASQVALVVKNPPANAQNRREMRVRSLSWEDSLEDGMATYSSILAWWIPGQRSLVVNSPQDWKSLTWMKQLSMHACTHIFPSKLRRFRSKIPLKLQIIYLVLNSCFLTPFLQLVEPRILAAPKGKKQDYPGVSCSARE